MNISHRPTVFMRNITKTFGHVIANKNIDFDSFSGEIHGLLGENGAGKSTLMSILSGYYRPDHGEIWINGKKCEFMSPADAIKHGIGMVYQHFSLINKFSILENILLNMPKSSLRKASRLAEDAQRLAKSLGFDIDPHASVSDLSVGQKQRVEILKILMRGSDIIILDEPTSILAPAEVSGLFKILRQLAKDGKTVIFITHKLEEVISLCDRVTVLRNGLKVGTLIRNEIESVQQLISMIFGQELLRTETKRQNAHGSELVRTESLTVTNDAKVEVVRGVDLTIYRGEILGIAGVEGNGQYELAEALAGIRQPRKGHIYFDGKKISEVNPKLMYDLGVRYITADRIEEGLVQDFNLVENLVLKIYRDSNHVAHLIPWNKFRKMALDKILEFKIVTRDAKSAVRTLSGGNQQKLLVARELLDNPKLIIANQPTHGLDVKTSQYIRNKFLEQASTGSAILLISNDLNEVLELSDRIAVMFRGKIVGIFSKEQADREMIGKMMVGVEA